MSDLSWMEAAVCAGCDPDAWFPEKGASSRQAAKVCAGCTVRVECFTYALQIKASHGIWGGLRISEAKRL